MKIIMIFCMLVGLVFGGINAYSGDLLGTFSGTIAFASSAVALLID